MIICNINKIATASGLNGTVIGPEQINGPFREPLRSMAEAETSREETMRKGEQQIEEVVDS